MFKVPVLYENLRPAVQEMWWENPTEKLTVDMVLSRLREEAPDLMFGLKTMNENDKKKVIQTTLEHLELFGMVNKPLLIPIQNKERPLIFVNAFNGKSFNICSAWLWKITDWTFLFYSALNKQ